jgi:hypothetical protein
MKDSQPIPDRGAKPTDYGSCERELHLQLCARRGPAGHLEFRWRVEHVDNIDQDGDSLEGRFGPFDLPHEMGQEVAAVCREWIRQTLMKVRERAQMPDELAGEQLTLRDFLTQ